MQLEKKIVLVTGAGTGIGQAIAIALAERGAHVVLVGRRIEALDATRKMICRADRATLLPADVTDAGDRQEISLAVREKFGRLNVLVNNAGVVEAGPLAEMPDETARRMIDTNLLAPVALTRELLPLLKAGAPARVVNVGSVFGDIAHPLFAAYSASKFGLRGFSDALRRELAETGVGVTYAAPRATRTPAAEGFADLIAPLGMRLDPPERVARMIVHALERDAAVAYPFGLERMFVLVQRLLPSLIDAGLRRKTALLPARTPQPGGRSNRAGPLRS
jgi:short-subunit dehydrogenase